MRYDVFIFIVIAILVNKRSRSLNYFILFFYIINACNKILIILEIFFKSKIKKILNFIPGTIAKILIILTIVPVKILN